MAILSLAEAAEVLRKSTSAKLQAVEIACGSKIAEAAEAETQIVVIACGSVAEARCGSSPLKPPYARTRPREAGYALEMN